MKSQSIYNAIYRGSILSALCVCLLPAVSVAQQYYDRGLLQKTVDRKPVDYQAPGIRVGSFILNPGAELAWEHNDNIFYMREKEIDDNIFHLRPYFNLNSDWNRHELNFNAFADFAWYDHFNGQNYQDWVVSLDGRFDVRRGSAFNYKASYMNLHEDRRNPDDRSSIKPTEYSFGGFDVDYTHTFNRLTAALGYRYHDFDYDNGKDIFGEVIDNQDRDRSRDAWFLRGDYAFSEQSAVFVEYAGNNIDYDQQYDRGGFERSSDGYDIRGGLAWDMTGVLTGDVYLVYVDQDYDDERLNDVNGFGVGANVDWTPTELTNVSFKFDTTPQQTTLADTSGYLSRLYSARVQHELKRNLLLNARLSYTDNSYEIDEFLSEDYSLTGTQISRAGLGITYLFNRSFYFSGGYVYEKQDANEAGFRYKSNRFFLVLGGEL